MNTRTFALDDPALPMNYPGFVFRSLCNDGHDPKTLLAGTDLSAEHLQDPNFRTGFAPLRQFLLNAIATTGDRHLGIRLAWRFEPNYIGLPAYAAMNAAHFQDALVFLTRFFFLSFPAIDFSFPDGDGELKKGEAGVRLRPRFPLEDITYFGVSSALIGCNDLLKAMLRIEQVTSRGEMTIRKPEGWEEIAGDIGFPIRFEAHENRLIFPSELLTQPLPGADPINHQRLLELCEKFAADAEYETTLASRVLSLLETDGNLGASLSEAAATLGYSERGLRRQLERTGTSFRVLTDQVRERRAKELLIYTARSVQEIAYELGYEAPSNFARSFKRWTGASPTEFREVRRLRTERGRN
ncbi:MAG: AraC family transcriptional regulator ligand-binding domain-containing protein [Planctomycetota bacterium]